jgi:dolichol kinase
MKAKNRFEIDNLNRKLIHIVSAFIIISFPYFLDVWQIASLSVLFSFIFLISKIKGFLPIINRVKRVSWGEVFYPLGVMISALLFLPQGEVRAFQFGVLVLGLSDAMANIIGDMFGSIKIEFPWSKKSLEGSLAFFATSLILFLLFFGFSSFTGGLFSILVASLLLTLAEFSLFFGIDNLVLPSFAAYLFVYIS